MSAQTDRFVLDHLPPRDQWPQMRYDLAELQLPAQLNAAEELLDKAVMKGFGNRPLLRSPRVTFTYAQARERVDRIAQVLTEDLGLVPGNRVLLRGGNSVGMALAWLAVVKAGLVVVATMPLLRARELGDIIDKSQPVAAICDAKLLGELEQAQQEQPALKTILKLRRPRRPARPGCACDRRQARPLRAVPHGGRRHRAHGLHLRHHRQAQGGGAHPPRRAGRLRSLAAPRAEGARPKTSSWARRRWPSPSAWAACWCFPCGPARRSIFPDVPYTPEAMVKLINEVGATICYTAPTFYRQMAPFAQASTAWARCASASAPARACPTPRASSGRKPAASRCSTASAPPRCSTSSSPLPAARCGAAPSARWSPATRAKVVDDDGQRSAARHRRQARGRSAPPAAATWTTRARPAT